jgi:hypothetical protein
MVRRLRKEEAGLCKALVNSRLSRNCEINDCLTKVAFFYHFISMCSTLCRASPTKHYTSAICHVAFQFSSSLWCVVCVAVADIMTKILTLTFQ